MTLKLILTILTTTILALLTSLLLSWPWIQAHWIRQGIVVALILVEVLHGVMVYLFLAKSLSEKQS